jgi:FtsP/CotA-like multicopper oxidase with cupredoxin domain
MFNIFWGNDIIVPIVLNLQVQYQNTTRLCQSKPLLTVNGQFPGPTIAVNEGDEVIVKVTNDVKHNTTIHWYGSDTNFVLWDSVVSI